MGLARPIGDCRFVIILRGQRTRSVTKTECVTYTPVRNTEAVRVSSAVGADKAGEAASNPLASLPLDCGVLTKVAKLAGAS